MHTVNNPLHSLIRTSYWAITANNATKTSLSHEKDNKYLYRLALCETFVSHCKVPNTLSLAPPITVVHVLLGRA